MGFLEALTIAFIVLKLVGVIAWPWWGVLAPLYPSVLIYLLMLRYGVKFWKRHKQDRQEIAADLKSFNARFDEDWPW
jgi:MFS superfamily sulfate permease-like transporter